MKFKFIGKEAVNFGMLGDVEPGQEFEVSNEKYLSIFIGNPRFEEIKSKKVVKKEEEVKEE